MAHSVGRERDERDTRPKTTQPRARGGLSIGGILTGVVVAFGAMFLLSAIIGGLLAVLGIAYDNFNCSLAIDD